MNKYGPLLGLVVLLYLAAKAKDRRGILGDTVVRPGGEMVLGDTMGTL